MIPDKSDNATGPSEAMIVWRERDVDIRIMFQQAENPSFRPTRLSDFGDKLGYNGAVPSAKYLSFMYKSMHKKIRAHIDQQQQCQVESDMLAIDASFKAMSHLARVDGIPVYKALITVCNEFGMIRCQTATCTDSHEQIVPALEAMQQTEEMMGRPGPAQLFTDNVAKDKWFLLKTFPSLQRREDYLTKMCEEERQRRLLEKASAQVENDQPVNSEGQTENDAATNAGTEEKVLSYQCIHGIETINLKMRSLADQFNMLEGPVEFGFDIAWDTIINP